MSTISFQLHEENSMNLARSIVLKDSNYANAYNQYVAYSRGVVGPDPKTWKYYLNLSGQYHAVDTMMTVKSLDTMEEIQFTRENLLQHRATMREYSSQSDYFKTLVARYPHQEILIRGILNPVPVDKVVSAEDFEIVHYDKSLVEAQEINLIPDLQKWVYGLVKQFYVPAFRLSDDLYPTVFHSNIATYFKEKIENIRLANCNTYHAHSYYIWLYLESMGRLSKYREVLTLQQTMWLYRNIRSIYRGIGRSDTFEALLENILTARGIPLGSYDMRHDVSAMPVEVYPTPIMQRTALNLFSKVPEHITNSDVFTVMSKQLPLAINNLDVFDSSYTAAMSRYRIAAQNSQPTMVYESEMVDLAGSEPYTLEDVLFNNWLAMAATNRYRSVIVVQNPATGDSMTMNMKEAFLVALYATSLASGIELEYVPDLLRANSSYKVPEPRFDDLRGITRKKNIPDAEIKGILDAAPIVGSPISTEAFYRTCYEIHSNMLDRHFYYTTKGDKNSRIDAEILFDALYDTREHKLNEEVDETFAQYFDRRGWDILDLNRSDADIVAKAVTAKATGADTEVVISLSKVQAGLMRLMRQLGSYSVHYIPTINQDAVIPAGLNPIRTDRAKLEVVKELPITFNPIEINVTDVKDRNKVEIGVGYITPDVNTVVGLREVSVRPKADITPLGEAIVTVKMRLGKVKIRDKVNAAPLVTI